MIGMMLLVLPEPSIAITTPEFINLSVLRFFGGALNETTHSSVFAQRSFVVFQATVDKTQSVIGARGP
jgi:hypothetical protein